MNQRMYRAWCEVIGADTSYFVPFHAGSEKIGPEYVIIALQQATGAADSNGTPIFEGDVVEYTQGLFNMDPARFPRKRKVVEYDTLTARFNLYETNAGQSDFVVVGNIFENPELLDENGRAKQPEEAPEVRAKSEIIQNIYDSFCLVDELFVDGRDRENGAGFSFDFENLAISHNDGDEDQPDSYSGWLLTVNYRPDGALEGWNYRMLVNPGETEEWAADSQVPEEHKAEIIEDLKYALNTIENMTGVRLDETNGPALPETTSETQEN